MSSTYHESFSLALNFIFRNNEETLPAMLGSVLPHVDEAVAVDTGSTDESREICESMGVKVIDGSDLVADDGYLTSFADARNRALNHTDSPFVLWLDTDDELVLGHGLKKLVRQCMSNEMVGVCYATYNYERDKLGRLIAVQQRERIFRRKYARWRNVIHECLHFIHSCTSVTFNPDDLVVEHKHRKWEGKEQLVRNAAMLRRWLKTTDRPAFVKHYLGKTLTGLDATDEAIRYLTEAHEESTDVFVRFDAAISLADIYIQNENFYLGWYWATKALYWCGTEPRPYLLLARCAAGEGRWDDSIFYTHCAENGIFQFRHSAINPLQRDALSRYLRAQALYEQEKYREANKLLADVANAVGIEEGAKATHALLMVTAQQEEEKIICQKFLEEILRGDPFRLQKMAPEMDTPVANLTGWGLVRESQEVVTDRDIDFVCGDTFEAWTGKTVDEEMVGGSEHQMILLAEEMARRGWRPKIYNGRRDGTIETVNGVEYRPFKMYPGKERRNIIVAYRSPWILDHPVQARGKFLWCQDVVNPFDWSPWRVENLTGLVLLSEWQSEPVRDLLGSKIHIIGNCVAPYDMKPANRDPNKVVYSSAPYRGMDVLLKVWPEIKRRVPLARLKIMGGFSELWNQLLQSHRVWNFDHLGPRTLSWYRDYINRLSAAVARLDVDVETGATPRRVAEELRQAALWLYPCTFNETFCIAAAEAQYHGAVPVAPSKAALSTTVRHGFSLPDPCWEDKQAIVDTVVGALTNQGRQQELREAGQVFAQEEYNLSRRADQWEALFRASDQKIEPIKVLRNEPLCLREPQELVNQEYQDTPWFSTKMGFLMRLLREAGSRSVLDLGCGTGETSVVARRGGVDTFCIVDLHAESLRVAKDRLERSGADVMAVRADLDGTWPVDGEFDAVLAFEVLEHLRDPQAFLEQAKSKLKPGGLLLLSTPAWSGEFGYYDRNPCHLTLWTRDGLLETLGEGAEVATTGDSLVAKWEKPNARNERTSSSVAVV